MNRRQVQTARHLALHILQELPQREFFVNQIADYELEHWRIPPNEAGLTTHLVYGVLRRRATLDALLRPCTNRPLRDIEPWLRDCLRLGAYQLAFLSRIPPHAAVHETVELAAFWGRPRAKRFLNAVLRRVTELLTTQTGSEPAEDALPWENGVYRLLARPVFANPRMQPSEYLAAAMSWPRWLAERWLQQYGLSECLRLGFWFVQPSPLWLRVNRLKITRSALMERFQQAGIASEAGDYPYAIRLQESVPIRDLPGFAEGWFTVQDESAMHAAAAVAPEPGWRVLDLCAAPGGKTTHLAELMDNQGQIVACDVSPERLCTLEQLTQRLGITIVTPHVTGQSLPEGPFDAALVDVPCTNTGVLGRRPEVRWRLRTDSIQKLVPLQTQLLLQAAERVREGGIVVYSTCSVEPEENEELIRAVVSRLPWLRLDCEHRAIPGQPADGGYWARLRRIGTIAEKPYIQP
jgi:16S rRNA (cytosine967-C5)-methyltransferase